MNHINVLKAINLDEKLAKGTIKISLGVNNTVADVDAIATALIKTHAWLLRKWYPLSKLVLVGVT